MTKNTTGHWKPSAAYDDIADTAALNDVPDLDVAVAFAHWSRRTAEWVAAERGTADVTHGVEVTPGTIALLNNGPWWREA